MRRPHDRYLFLAVFSLSAGLVTLASGNTPMVAVVELLLAITCALFSLRGRRGG